ncbi:MAG: RnfABCDGE type electron transport complex subunit D [Chloroflexi bacterium]|nr:MAG: RnfABCDGE type electron transport complex subunit D [Chloroflexota bacterium]
MLDVRQLWPALRGIPQLLLVQPEQLSYDLAYALALLPLIVAGIIFFLQDAILLFAMSFLAGIVCLLAIQLARLTFGLPAWVGFKATHPLVASILVACFLSPRTPAWVAATMVILFVIIDTVLWPQLHRVMLHPALIIFGLLFVIDRQLGVGFVNPFDGRHLDDPLLLWYRLQVMIDPVKLYVGNVPGPIGVTSAGAVLLGVTYLWYTRKLSLGVIAGFLAGIAAVAMVLRSDLGFQLASGPSLFIAGYIAADRRRVVLGPRFTFLFGAAAGVAVMILRWYGEGLQASWQGFLLVSMLVTIGLRVQAFIRRRGGAAGGRMRTLTIESGDHGPRPALAPIRSEVRQPVMATAPVSTSFRSSPLAAPGRRYDSVQDSNDLVRQMRSAATRGSASTVDRVILLASLLVVNPVGLWLTWKTRSMTQQIKLMLTGVSVLWYLGVAGLAFALLHR